MNYQPERNKTHSHFKHSQHINKPKIFFFFFNLFKYFDFSSQRIFSALTKEALYFKLNESSVVCNEVLNGGPMINTNDINNSLFPNFVELSHALFVRVNKNCLGP